MLNRIISMLACMIVLPLFGGSHNFNSVIFADQSNKIMPAKHKTVSFLDSLQLFENNEQSSDTSEQGDSGRSSTTECAIVEIMLESGQQIKNHEVNKKPSERESSFEEYDHTTNTPSPDRERKNSCCKLGKVLSIASTTSLCDHVTETPSPKKAHGTKTPSERGDSLTSSWGSFRRSNSNLFDCTTKTPSERGDGSPMRLFPDTPSTTILTELQKTK